MGEVNARQIAAKMEIDRKRVGPRLNELLKQGRIKRTRIDGILGSHHAKAYYAIVERDMVNSKPISADIKKRVLSGSWGL